MKMVSFIDISPSKVISEFIYKENQDFSELDQIILVPNYLVLEAMFQTAGRVAREYSNNKCGGSIVSFSNFNLVRPIFCNELLHIKAELISFNQHRRCFFLGVSVYKDQEVIVKDGRLLIIQDTAIQPQFLNNRYPVDINHYLEKLGF